MCQENTLDIVDWPRPHKGDDCSDIIRSLDPSRDVLLFPSPDAILASKFLWGEDDVTLAGIFTSTNGNPNTNVTRRRRLVVLEASWAHGKTMAAQIKSFREQFQLPPIPYVKLEDIVGQYWRFHCEGNAAVSTIEAIAYAAHAAGLSDDLTQDLLILFQVQKYRVLKQVEDGGKPPQALEVAGSGIGSWKQLTDQVRNFGD